MKTTLIAFLTLAFSHAAVAQLAQVKPVGSDSWGYINTKGELVIPADFRKCNAFSDDGYAAIYEKKKKSFYFIDQKGDRLETDQETFLLKNVFGFGTLGFADGMALFSVKKKWGYMNTQGKTVISPTYAKANVFNGGLATAMKGNSWIILDKTGKEIEVALSGLEGARRFSEGMCGIKKGGLWGFADASGKVVVEPQFKGVGYFVDGLAYAKKEDGTVGFIDKTGAFKIEANYSAAKDFNGGAARVKSGDTWKFVTVDGKEVDPEIGESFGKVSDGLAYAKTGDLVGFVNKDGSTVIKPTFEKVRDFHHGLAAVRKGDLWGFINKEGNWVIEPSFSAVKDFHGKK